LRRTAFTRIDGAVDIVDDDWSLMIDGMSAARIYRVRGGPPSERSELAASDLVRGSCAHARSASVTTFSAASGGTAGAIRTGAPL
jgi:hypothetical protein